MPSPAIGPGLGRPPRRRSNLSCVDPQARSSPVIPRRRPADRDTFQVQDESSPKSASPSGPVAESSVETNSDESASLLSSLTSESSTGATSDNSPSFQFSLRFQS